MENVQSSGIIPVIHRLVTSEHGENYWFNAKACYVMECLGERDYDYSFFAGLTGDTFLQHYKFGFYGDGASSYHQFGGDGSYFEGIFAKCGYTATYVSVADICRDREAHLQRLRAYIDRGVPVISLGAGGTPAAVYVGYEEGGKTLLFISGDSGEPQRISYEKALESAEPGSAAWIFVGKKRESLPLAEIYRSAILALPGLLTLNNGQYCFGAAAFYKWAEELDGGIFDNIKPEDFDAWGMYRNFICVLATNGSCCYSFLEKARELNPDMCILKQVEALYRKTKDIWDELEEIGCGLQATLELLQDREKRAQITVKLRRCAAIIEEVVSVLEENTGNEGKTAS